MVLSCQRSLRLTRMTPTAERRSGRGSASAGTVVPDARLVRDIYAEERRAGRPVVSIELFPPRTPEGLAALFERTLPAMQAIRPHFYSVTYGAGGSTRDRTLDIADRIQREHGATAMAHLTCISTPRPEIERYLLEARERGIRNVLALRGDPPQNVDELAELDSGFEYSHQLVAFIRRLGGFSIGTAGFPESHVACTEGKHVDWQRLKDKVDAGADLVLTQLFFDNDDYFAFRDYLVDTLGVQVPLTPGVLPILSAPQIKRFTAICGATLPAPLIAKLEGFGDDDEAVADFGIEFATRQCEALLAGGAPGLHVYSLNRARAVTSIVESLGLRG